MGQVIHKFSDGSFLEYDQGRFDDWCVYFSEKDGTRNPPRDEEYFSELKEIAGRHGTEKVYADYVSVYDLTGKSVDDSVFSKIAVIAGTYGADSLEMEKILSILYMAMIAEEKKEYTRLGKRIKRLGIHKLLLEDSSVKDAANFMRGMNWRQTAKLCEDRGF